MLKAELFRVLYPYVTYEYLAELILAVTPHVPLILYPKFKKLRKTPPEYQSLTSPPLEAYPAPIPK